MRTVYLGTSDFAARVLGRLADSPHRPALVVTPPDRRKGRGRRMASPLVADAAREAGIELLQAASVNEPEAVETIRAAEPEIAAVCAFGQLIKPPLLDELEMLNVHPSLLPRWRGAAPIERAIMAGDEQTGVTIMRLTEGLDSGPIGLQEEVAVGPGDDFGDLEPRLADLGGELLVRAFDLRAAGKLDLAEQDDSQATYAEKIAGADRRLDPARPATELARTVRALTPHIGAFFEVGEADRLGVRSAEAAQGDLEPGTVAAADGGLAVGTAEGILRLLVVQPPGGKPMSVADYLRGRRPPAHLH